MSLSPAFLDELRARTLLSALIGRTHKILKAGREYKGLCPFHNDTRPSFYVNDEKGFYHCFSCSAHGDAIRWMTDQRGLGFMDAVKELADAAGMEVPSPDPRAAERAEHANSLYDVMQAAQDWFVAQLGGIEGAEARAYLEKRGLQPETAKQFGIGFAPDSRGKLKSALAKFGEDKLIESGLLISVEDKDPYDRFRGRLMIPIRDPRGRVIAFGGRILGAGEPKYLNSPDTPLFDKGRTLYNLDQAGPASRKTDRVIVVEGYMDVIALAQAGIGDAVAPLGTALTEHQIARLWRLSETPILCFDGDAAGQKAAVRAICRAIPGLAPARSLAFVTLPAGQDPDDVIKSAGRAGMDSLLDDPEALVDRLWRHEFEAQPLRTPEARAGFRQRMTSHAQAIENGNVRDQYLAEFRARFSAEFGNNSSPSAAQQFRSRYLPERPPGRRTKAIGNDGIESHYARAILAGLLHHPSAIRDHSEGLSLLSMRDERLDQLRLALLDAIYDHPTLDSGEIIAICDAQGFGPLVMELKAKRGLAFSFSKPGTDPVLAKRDLAIAIDALISRPELDAALDAATARLARNMDEAGLEEQSRLREARAQLDQKLAAIAADEHEIV